MECKFQLIYIQEIVTFCGIGASRILPSYRIQSGTRQVGPGQDDRAQVGLGRVTIMQIGLWN